MKDEKCCKQSNAYVALAGVICAISLVMVIMTIIFAKEYMETLVPIVWGLVILGIILGLFQYKSEKPATKK